MRNLNQLFAMGCMAALMIGASSARASNEALMGVFVSPEGVHVQVVSGGCTDKNSFRVVRSDNGGVATLYFERIQQDNCLKEMPFGQVLVYPYNELNLREGDQFQIRNPIVSHANSGLNL